MSKIKYVCLSDLHLGEESSLLTKIKSDGTADPGAPSAVMERLVACLHDLLVANNLADQEPTLILNGDIVELALCSTEKALMVFARFVECLAKPSMLFEHLVYLPGNHDHHLWETARERQYLVNYLANPNILPADDPLIALRPARHTTKLCFDHTTEGPDRTFTRLLTVILRRVLQRRDCHVVAAYPNFGVKGPGGRWVVFHHGHFIEKPYRAMSIVIETLFNRKLPATVGSWEGANFAWIDFFWSALGRQEETGPEIEGIYKSLHSKKARDRLVQRAAAACADRLGIDWLPKRAVKRELAHVFGLGADFVAKNLEKKDTSSALSKKGRGGLKDYLEGPLLDQFKIEIGEVPARPTFVFGHTHKPDQDQIASKAYGGVVTWLNTGGWVVDTAKEQSLYGGGVVLVDEVLNALNLRMYNEGTYQPHVEEAAASRSNVSRFAAQIQDIISADQRGVWRNFASTIASERRDRAQFL